MEMSVVETQRLILKWQEDQLLQDQSCLNELNLLTTHSLPGQAHNFPGCGPSLNGLLAQPIKADPGVENGWVDNDPVGQVINSCGGGYGVNYGISRTASCPPPLVAAETRGRDLSGAAGRESFTKRKSDKSLGHKGDAEEDSRSKRSKGCEEEEESKVTEQQNSNRNSNGSQSNNIKESNGNNKLDKKNREASGCTSKDNSNVEKPDYIHVRARRGQATDSHSLAERVRREKISERMKYLQDLVPGCNKITGKAGMLDEIINYVQSLQRQVEFLSMKLAAVNPRLDFSIDELIAKEVFAACSTSMPTMGVSPDMSNPNYIQYNPIQQMDSNPIDMGLRRTISAPVSVPETFINPSCFNLPSSLPWDAELQNIYAMEFQQGRSTSFPLQTFAGTIEDSSLRMEM